MKFSAAAITLVLGSTTTGTYVSAFSSSRSAFVTTAGTIASSSSSSSATMRMALDDLESKLFTEPEKPAVVKKAKVTSKKGSSADRKSVV